jgi:hypothetical protein
MQRVLPWLTAVLFCGCLVLGYLLLHLRAEMVQTTLTWDTGEKETQKRILDLQHKLAASEKAQALAATQIAQLSQAPAAASGNANGGRRIVHISDIVKDHPEYEGLYAKQLHRNIDRMYGNLASLNLSPDQITQLKNLLVERQMASMDAQSAAEAAGLQQNSPEWREAMKQASQGVEPQLIALLGPNADSTLTQLQVRGGMQTQVEFNYAPDFAEAGAPLTADQTTALVQAMADANYGGKDVSTRPANYNEVDPNTGLSPHDDRIINSAAQSLSPAQIQVLKTDQAEMEQQSAIIREYNKGGGNVMFVP